MRNRKRFRSKPNTLHTMKNKKFIFLHLEVQHGEYTFDLKGVHELEPEQDIDEFAINYAKGFYSDNPEQEEDGRYYFFFGEIAVKIEKAQEIAPAEFEILNRYL